MQAQASAIEALPLRGLDGIAIAGDVRGDPSAAPVLLLHGGGQSRTSWRATAAALADRGLRVTTIDLRGHGESAWAKGGDYRLDCFAEDLRCVLGEMGGKPVIVGASLGGLAALLACGESPQVGVAGLVLVDIVPRLAPTGGEHVVNFMRSTLAGFDSLEDAAETIAHYLPHRPQRSSAAGLAKNLRAASDGRFYWRWDPAFVAPSAGWDPEAMGARLEQAATRITAPILMVRGGRSEIVTCEALDHFRQRLPQAEIAEIPHARHMLAGDDNDAFLAAITDFVVRHADRGEH